MNIRKLYKKAQSFYHNLGFLKKMLCIYFICCVIPISIMMTYYGYSTIKMMLDQAYATVRQNVITSENSLNTMCQPYKSIIDTIKNDKDLNIQLNMDYTNVSYSDLSYYMSQNVDPIYASYPDVEGIHFYSNNITLPEENYYFFRYTKLSGKLRDTIDSYLGKVVAIAGEKDSGTAGCIRFLSKINYFASSSFQNYMEIVLNLDSIENLFYQTNDYTNLYLIDHDGNIIDASDGHSSMNEILPDWKSMEEDKIVILRDVNELKMIGMKKSMDMGMTLIMLEERKPVILSALEYTLKVLFVMFIITVVLTMISLVQSRKMNDALTGILSVLEKAGQGDFDQEITIDSQDEFGRIGHAVNDMTHRLDILIKDNYQKQITITNTELNLLQEQINPHFLYNALGVISSLGIREGSKATVQSIRYLADFYRISLNKGRKVIHISEEINLLKNYMKIQLLRFADYVEISYQLDPQIEDYYTIKLLLQPLVENAIHHAREEEMFLSIKVVGYQKEDRVCLQVQDNGHGIQPETLRILQEQLARQEEGFGLKNVDKRIKLAYGDAYGITLFSQYGQGEEPHGTTIHIEIPIVKERT